MGKKIHYDLICILILFCCTVTRGQEVRTADICIYGGSSAGVIAAYTASKAGKSVILIDPGDRLGGLSSGGLGQTDIGNKYVVKGLALDFYRKMGKHYGGFEQWVFEPKVAEGIFKGYMEECEADVLFGHLLLDVDKEGTDIREIRLHRTDDQGVHSLTVQAKVFMDCTYEGDLFAKAGASYHVGRESNSTYSETLNGVQLLTKHQFPDGVDPYVNPGDKSSGLVWGIRDGAVERNGTGDDKVQAYNYRITLTNVPENRVPITEPDNYDPARYELLRRQKEIDPWKALTDVFIWSLMPNGKTDINNRNGFSTDMIGANWDYPEADHARRQEIIKEHEDYTKGLLYFVGNDASVPAFIRDEMKEWGYPKDEYVDNGHWTPQLYIREARRLIGELVMTQHHCQGRDIVTDAVGYAAYQMDSHNCDRLVVNGMVKNEGNVEVGGFPPFPISYRSIVPKREEVSNLLVPVCISASHIAFGSIRMEPVFMVLAQSAAVAACLAIDQDKKVQEISITDIDKQFAANPKADHRKTDVLVDFRDPTAVTLDGEWEENRSTSRRGYGPIYKQADSKKGLSTARFNPKELTSGEYEVYTYYSRLPESSKKLTYRIHNGEELVEEELDLTRVEIKGQTSGAWVSLGKYEIKEGTEIPYVELSNEGADGIVVANAVLFVPEDDH